MAFIISSIVGSTISGGANIIASQNAASAQRDAANQASATQLGMFNKTQQNLAPFIGAGQSGIPNLQGFIDPNNPNSTFGHYQAWNDPNNANSPLAALLRLTTPGPNQNAALEATPGYQFQETQGLKAVNNALASRGLAGSGGPVAKGAAAFTTGLAQSNWQSIVQQLLNTYSAGNVGMGNVFNAGAGANQNFVNTGANAAAGLGNNAVSTGGQIGSNIIGAGNANAGASIAAGNAVGGIGNSLTTGLLLNRLTGGGGSIYDSPGSLSSPNPLLSGTPSENYDPPGPGVY